MLHASEFGRTIYEARSSRSELCRNPLDIRQPHSLRLRRRLGIAQPPVILETGDLLLELRDSRCLLAKRIEFRGADGNHLHKRYHLNILFVILHTHVTSNDTCLVVCHCQ